MSGQQLISSSPDPKSPIIRRGGSSIPDMKARLGNIEVRLDNIETKLDNILENNNIDDNVEVDQAGTLNKQGAGGQINPSW